MKIGQIRVSNFRALRDVDLLLTDYTSLIGPNGSGKSSILYALDWFFGNREIDDQSHSYDPTSKIISVELTVTDLSASQVSAFGTFALNGEVRLKKSYDCENDKVEFTGTAWIGPGFSEVLTAPNAIQMREAYKALREIHDDLEGLSGNFGKEKIQSAFDTWCNEPSNRHKLIETQMDASALFQKEGPVASHFKFILVKGAMNFAEEINAHNRNSLMSVLTKSLLEPPKKPIIDAWKVEHEEHLTKLEESLVGAVNGSLSTVNQSINANLNRYDKNLTFALTTSGARIELDFPTFVDANIVGKEGKSENLATQGHGIQRTVIMSMIEALNARRQIDDDTAEDLVIIAAEEPELYQHPVRARSFFRTLRSLAKQKGFQVLLATHSPEFVSSDFLTSLRFVRKSEGYTNIKSTSLEGVAKVRGKHKNQVHEWLSKELPKSMSDAFFADLVLLTEGETDEALWPEIADLLSHSFDHIGVVCMCAGSKTSLVTTRDVLNQFGVRSFIIADGDYRESDNDSQREQTQKLIEDLKLFNKKGTPLYNYGEQSKIIGNLAILKGTIEEELENWPSFQAAMMSINPRSASKKAHHYRMAARNATVESMPYFLKAVIAEVVKQISTYAK